MILITTQTFPPVIGGMENLMGGLAGALADQGRPVTVFADGKGDPAESVTDSGYAFCVRRFGGPRPWRRFRKARAIAREMQNTQAIVADSWKSLEQLNPVRRPPIACLAHGKDMLSDSTTRSTRIARALNKANWIVANSAYVADLARGHADQPESVRIIPPGLAALPVPDPAKTAEFEKIVSARGPILTTLARLEPRKGVDMVIQALPRLARIHPDILYLVGGDGKDQKRLQRLAMQLGVSARVHFAGALVRDRAALLRASNLFVMPTRRIGRSVEGFGIVYLEAAACAIPSLGGKVGGARDAIGETGFLCDGGNAQAVEDALAGALSDLPRLTRMGHAAQKRTAEFSWNKIALRHLALLNEGKR